MVYPLPVENDPVAATPPALLPYQLYVVVNITLILLVAGAARYFVESVVIFI
jgi:hypothetical protein